jgi:hypothetical protein
MKRHSIFAATALAGALAISMPAVAGGLLGGISGGAGAGVLGGGTLSSPVTNFGAGGVLGATSQFQGQVMQPNLTIQRPTLPTVSPNFGAGAGGTLDATGQQAAGEIGGAISPTNRSAQATGGAFAGGNASAGRASVGAESSAQAGVRAGY